MQGLDLSSQNNNLEKIKKKSETKKQNQALELKRGEINFRKKLGEKEKIAEKKNLKDIENASNGKVKDKLTRNKQENQQSKQIHRNQSQSKQIHQKDEISFEEVKKETKTKEVRNEKNKAKPTKKRGAELWKTF